MPIPQGQCTHSEKVSRFNPYHHFDEYGEYVGDYEMVKESTYVDANLHSAKCTRCGHVMYYSSAGRIAEQQKVSLEVAMGIRDNQLNQGK